MTKFFYFLILIFFYTTMNFSCASNKFNSKKILISFEIANLEVKNICNNFTVDFVYKKSIYNGKVDGCYMKLPNIPKNIEYIDVVFKYDSHNMTFKDVELKWLMLDLNMNWNFKISLPPFEELNNPNLNLEEIEKIYYFQFNPLDGGQSVEIINPISG